MQRPQPWHPLGQGLEVRVRQWMAKKMQNTVTQITIKPHGMRSIPFAYFSKTRKQPKKVLLRATSEEGASSPIPVAILLSAEHPGARSFGASG